MNNIIIGILLLSVIITIVFAITNNKLEYAYYSVIYLTILSLISWIYFYNKIEWAKELSQNFFFLFLGILVVTFMIDRIIERNNAIERKKYEYTALSHLRIPVIQHSEFLFNLYKASSLIKPDKEIIELKDLFSQDYYKQLAYLDFSKEAPVLPRTSYFEYCARESEKFKESMSNTLDKYSVYL